MASIDDVAVVFPAKTDKLKGGTRGGKLGLVDTALQFWIDTKDNGMESRKAAAMGLSKACKGWLSEKSSKSETKLFGKVNELLARRRLWVSKLGQAALEELVKIDGQLSARANFDTKAMKMLEKGTAGAATRGLGKGYDNERKLYEASGKAHNPISGTYMHQTQDQARNPENLAQMGATLDRGEQKVVGKPFEKLTEGDFEVLERVLGKVNPVQSSYPGGSHVYFMKKEVRLNHMLIISEGGFLQKSNGENFSTEGKDKPETAYAVDGYGNMFALRNYQGGMESFNHSSFTAGKGVMCAGEVTVIDGFLTRINNNSGHYKPTRENMMTLMRFLRDEGLSLTYHTGAGAVETNVELKTSNGWDSFKASTFLNGGQPDGLKLNFHGLRIA